MNISIISGSHRENSQSERVARYIEQDIKSQGMQGTLITLAKNPLPLWDEGVWSGEPHWETTWGPIAETLQKSDALVLVSPEWSGMVPAGLKNFLLLCGTKEVGHKPAMIVSVSSGVGGSYPIAELRLSSYKNNRLVYVPDHVIVRNVETMLVGDTPADDRDAEIRKRLHYSLEILAEYAKAFKGVRASGKINVKDFPYGM